MAEPNTFLTEDRQAVLHDNYDGSSSTERVHRRNIKKRSQSALQELTEVAQSPHIDNSEVFDPSDVHALLTALLTPPSYTNPMTGEIPDADDDFLAYRDRMYVQIDKVKTYAKSTDDTLNDGDPWD